MSRFKLWMAPDTKEWVLTAHGNDFPITIVESKNLVKRLKAAIKRGRPDDRAEKPFRLRHGKHKGKSIDEVPAMYLLRVFTYVMEQHGQFMRYVRAHYNSIKLRADNERKWKRSGRKIFR